MANKGKPTNKCDPTQITEVRHRHDLVLVEGEQGGQVRHLIEAVLRGHRTNPHRATNRQSPLTVLVVCHWPRVYRVADRAGVSRTLVVFHFKSKVGLLTEVLNFLGARYSEGWDATIAAGGASTMEKILRLLDYDIRFASENPEFLSA